MSNSLEVVPLGAGCEVGRSCIKVSYHNRTILLDCGIHPAHTGLPALPVFDGIDLSTVDLCLVTHFHLDHCGVVPYLLQHTWFRGKTLMTEPTKAICHLVWNDFAAFAKHSGQKSLLYTEQDIAACLPKIDTIHFGQRYKHNGIEVTALGAGHVVGACMFLVSIDGVNILYTGDYSGEDERHVPSILVPPSFSVQVLICEATYGIRNHEARHAREARFKAAVDSVVLGRQGKCLLPIFALGRVQELLLILNEHWQENHERLKDVPIVYLSSLSGKGIQIMREYAATYAGSYVKNKALRGQNAFSFKYVKSAKSLDEITPLLNREGPCVILAAPGMLQSGASREIFELICGDRRNGVILTGYTLRGTLADQLKSLPTSIIKSDGRVELPVRSSFDIISFSAHADFDQSNRLIDTVQPPVVVLVHGEKTEMRSLQQKLLALRPSLAVFAPQILQKINVDFSDGDSSEIVGTRLARAIQEEAFDVEAVSLVKDDVRLFVAEEDLPAAVGSSVHAVHLESKFQLSDDAVEKAKAAADLTSPPAPIRQIFMLLHAIEQEKGFTFEPLQGVQWNFVRADRAVVANSVTVSVDDRYVTLDWQWSVEKEKTFQGLAYLLMWCSELAPNETREERDLMMRMLRLHLGG